MATQETSRVFQEMINDFLPNELLMAEMNDNVYALNKCQKDDSWTGQGDLIVPFEGAVASSLRYGKLTASSNIADDVFVRGKVETQKEIWGTMRFYSRDLMEHKTVSEKNFLQILPGRIDRFIKRKKSAVSTNLLIGAHTCKATAVATGNDGLVVVDRPDRVEINQMLQFYTTDATEVDSYVRSINVNTKTLVLYTARTGGSVINFSAGGKDLAVAAKLYNEDAKDNAFSSMRDHLLSAANGGTSTLYGVTKTDYPYLQAYNVDGGSSGLAITAENIVDTLFDAGLDITIFGKGNPSDIILSLKRWGAVVKVLQHSKGPFNVVPGSLKTNELGWKEISIGGPKGEFKVVGVHEADDDIAMFVDWSSYTFYSNGGFRKEMSPDGLEYFTVRGEDGYQYIIDLCLFGEFVNKTPCYNGIVYGISF
jgi:hypothetical protein